MPSKTDKLQKVGRPGTATTLGGAGYTIGGTQITVGSTTNMPTDTGFTFAIDQAQVVNGKQVRIDGTYCEFVGIVSNGTTIAQLEKVFGDSQDYPAGSLTRVYIPVSSERENRIVDWGLLHAGQDGKLLPNSIKNEMLDGAMIKNANLNAVAGELGGAWISWSPIMQNLAGGTLNYAKYHRIGKTVKWRFKYTLGTVNQTNGVLGNILISLPLQHAPSYADSDECVGSTGFRRAGVIRVPGDAIISTSNFVSLRYYIAETGTRISVLSTTPTTPITFISGDVITAEGEYEIA